MLSPVQFAVLRALASTFQNAKAKAWTVRDALAVCEKFTLYGESSAYVLHRDFVEPGILSVSPDMTFCKMTDYGRALYEEMVAIQKDWEELPIIPLDDTNKDQIIIKQGETFRGKYFVMQLFKKAHSVLRLHDNFCAHEILLWLHSSNPSVSVRLLTSPKTLKQDASFESLARAFVTERKTSEIRLTGDVHDRKIIIDDKEAFQVGESIKDIGSKGTTILRLQEVPQHIIAFDQVWGSAKSL